jgi:hypothetical protein
MRRPLVLALLLLTISGASYAVESGEVTMTIVSADQKTRDRVVAWVNDTPIYQPEPYFQVEVRCQDKLLEGQYEPVSQWETLPEFWKPGVEVQGRVRGHSLFLKRPNGVEIRFVILKRTAAATDKKR